MNRNDAAMVVLDEAECWELLATQQVGRLVTRVGEVVDIVPINFVIDGRGIIFRTAAGSKLSGVVVNEAVVFEVDLFGLEQGWSVVLHGKAHVLESEADIAAAEQLPLRPFVPTLKPTFVRVDAESLSGRAYRFGPEPRREDAQEG